MKTSQLLNLLCTFCFFSLFIESSIVAQTNLALTADLATSHVSSWENLDAVNDDYIPSSSTDKGPGAYGNWKGTAYYDTWEWVEYTFNRENQVDSVRVYWWTDGGGIQIPYSAYIQYWNCDSFVNAGYIGIEKDKFNTLFMNLKTFKIRVYMRSTRATGILELQVYGTLGPQIGLIPYIQINSQLKQQTDRDTIQPGDTVVLSAGLTGIAGGTCSWTGPKGFSSTDSVLTIKGIQLIQTGKYTASYESDCGILFKQDFIILADAPDTFSYYWTGYSPTLDYNFRQEYPSLSMPTKSLQDCNSTLIGGEISSEWWTFIWGKNKRSEISEAAITPMLERMNTDFAYIRDTMGWPPDKRIKDGYRSTIYLYGSGLCTDNADTNATGGWMSSVNNYPMVLISYYPVYCFDPSCPYTDIDYQTGAVVHEGIHAILADMPGCKEACWFQEGGNTWLQQEMEYRRSGIHSSMGSLNGCTFIAPFMPIECYSGWLQDNSFGGPCAEGVNMYNGSTQICTWRNYLGGNQYGNAFPTFLGQVLGKGSIPWIWRYCIGHVLEGMADTLGDEQIRRIITEYRAKQALVDFGEWEDAIRKLLDGNFNLEVSAEWTPSWLTPDIWIATPYARTTIDEKGLLTPEYRTTPGWSGANQIPLLVKSDSVYINFQPIGKNMKCQICYRDILGNPIYSEPVDSGKCSMLLQIPPANDVVIAVITSTDYVWEGNETGKRHYDYRLQIDTNLTMPAHTHKRWYAWNENPAADALPSLRAISKPDTLAPTDLSLALDTVYEEAPIGTAIGVFSTVDPNDVTIQTYSLIEGSGDDDNASFRISGSKLLTKKILDYETKNIYNIRVRTTNLTGKYFEKTFEIPVTDIIETAISENNGVKNKVLVFPNPVNQNATIQLINNEIIRKIELIDITGSKVKIIDNINATDYIINKEDLSNGIYFLKVDGIETYFIKIIFQ